MNKKTCETCDAFQPNKGNDKADRSGQCRAKSPKILTSWITPQGSGWQGGWPPTNADEWCRKHSIKLELMPGMN